MTTAYGALESRKGPLPGALALLTLALLALLTHRLAPQVPGAVWALGFGVLAGSAGARRELPSLPYHLPLTVGLILMGAQLHQSLFAHIGVPGLLAVGALWFSVATSFWLMARTGLLTPRLAGLFTLGLIGCGVSAIAGAAQQDHKAEGAPTAYATLAVLLSGAAGLLVYPLIGIAAGLDAQQFGALAGITIANSAEAVATAATHSDDALGVAAGYKLLVNTLQGVPILVYLWRFAPKGDATPGVATILQRVPFFVWGFVGVAVAASIGLFSESERASLGGLTRLAFFIALIGVGYHTRLDVIRRIGLRPILIGLAVWALAAAAVLIWILR
ncbi:MAG: YeiH family protein [Planctomycetes bacterium]|nr:YeiH family protein [Planctomycetota bacterium]